MARNTRIVRRVKGDIYLSETPQKGNRVVERYHVARPDARQIILTTGRGEAFSHLLNNLGKKFSRAELVEVSGIKDGSICSLIYDHLLYAFSCSECFDLVIEGEGKKARYCLNEIEPSEDYKDKLARRDRELGLPLFIES